MTNLLSSWHGLRSKWEVERHPRSSNVSGFLKRKTWLYEDDTASAASVACRQRTEYQNKTTAHKSHPNTCTDKRDKCLHLQTYRRVKDERVRKPSPLSYRHGGGAVRTFLWNRERWTCWNKSWANTSLLFTKTNVGTAIRRYAKVNPPSSSHMNNFSCTSELSRFRLMRAAEHTKW